MKWKVTLMISEATVSTAEVITTGEILIGRTPPADLEIGGATMSRRHALLRIDPRGAVTVEDAASTSGVWLNEERVEGPTAFGADDTVRLGHYRLRLLAVEVLEA